MVKKKMRHILALSVLVLGHHPGSHAQDAGSTIGCYVQGECTFSLQLDELTAGTPLECLRECQTLEPSSFGEVCSYFTHFADVQICRLFENCEELSASDCDDCISGESSCPEEICFVDGVRCDGTEVSVDVDAGSPEECLELCQNTDGCMWFTFDEVEAKCSMDEDCTTYTECEGCTAGSASCQTNSGADDVVTIMIAGGDSTGLHITNDVEIIQLAVSGEPVLSSCRKPSSLPDIREDPLGLTDEKGQPMVCGGVGPPKDDCFVYDRSDDSWSQGPTMTTNRYSMGVPPQLDDGRYLVTGGGSESADTYEFFDEGVFVRGATGMRPSILSHGCTVSLGDNLVFTCDQNQAFLFDAVEESFTTLPTIPTFRANPVCGVATSPSGDGMDVVVTGDREDLAEIYNTESGQWRRASSPAPELKWAASHPLGDTFVIIGGYGNNVDFFDTIYQYEPTTEGWTLRNETLALARNRFASAVVDGAECVPV